MKVYAVRAPLEYSRYRPTLGWFTSLGGAKKWAKAHIPTPEYEVLAYTLLASALLQTWVNLLNGDTLSADEALESSVPSDYTQEPKVVFQTAAMKRYEKEQRK